MLQGHPKRHRQGSAFRFAGNLDTQQRGDRKRAIPSVRDVAGNFQRMLDGGKLDGAQAVEAAGQSFDAHLVVQVSNTHRNQPCQIRLRFA